MSDVKGFKFENEVHQYDYDYLTHKPVPDKTLKIEGQSADAKAVGDLIKVSATQPTTASTKVWVESQTTDVEIPTYAEHEALASEVSTLKDDLKSALSEFSTDTYSVIGGKQRFDQHEFSLNNEYVNAYTAKYSINWDANAKLYFKVVADASIIPSFLLYVVDSEDTNHNLGSKSPNTEIEINVDYSIKAIYVYYGTKVTTAITYLFYRAYTNTLATKTELQTAETTINNKFSRQVGNFEIVEGATLEWVEETYIRVSDGAAVSNTSWYSTPFCPVFPKTNITIALANSSSVVGVAWYDENKHYISGETLVYNHSYVGEMDVVSPEKAKYMRYSTSNLTWSTSYAVIKDSVLNLTKNVYDAIQTQEESTTAVYWQFAMDKILCIGDSLTSGAYYDDTTYRGASIAQNYPYYIGRILNTDATNAGVSGISVKGWLDNESDNYTYTDYNTIIIWLGSNYGLRTDLPDNPTEGQTKAYQNYVAYRQLLTKIKTANPNALIVMCKIYFTNYWIDISNAALESIAAEYNLPLVDLSDLNADNYPEYRYPDVNRYHLIKCGNIVVASRIIESMRNWFADSPQRCEFGLSPRVT